MRRNKLKAIRCYKTTFKRREKSVIPVSVNEWVLWQFKKATELIIEATHMWRYFDKITFDFTGDERRKNEKK